VASTAKDGPPAGRGRAAADANADDSGEGSDDDIEDVDDEDSGDGSSSGGKGKGKGKSQGSTGKKKKKQGGKPRGAEVVAPDGFDYGAANDQLTALATAFNALVDFTKQGTHTHYVCPERSLS
jgi:hypothetical protein